MNTGTRACGHPCGTPHTQAEEGSLTRGPGRSRWQEEPCWHTVAKPCMKGAHRRCGRQQRQVCGATTAALEDGLSDAQASVA